MATDLERLVVQLAADIKGYERAMQKAQGVTVARTRAIENQFARSNKAIATSFAGLSRSFAVAFSGGLAGSGVQQLLDSATRIRNALKVIGLEGDEMRNVYDRLFAAAQKNAVPVESLVGLYSKLSLTQKELGVTSSDLVKFVNNVALALRVGGTDASAASGALMQLSQALGGGVVRAEEFNSILEGAPTIAQAAAAGLEDAAGSVAKLRTLVVDGKVSSEAFFRAFGAGATTLEDKVAGAETTLSGQFVRLQNVLIDTATRFDDQTDATRALGNIIEKTLIPAIQELGEMFTWLVDGPAGDFYRFLGDIIDRIVQMSADLGKMTGLDQIGGNPYIGPRRIQERIDTAFAGTSYSTPRSDRKPAEVDATDPNSVIKRVSLADYPVSGSGSANGKRKREDDLQREIRQIQERTAAIQAETAAMASLNPLVSDYGFALEKARAKQDLLTAAERAGISLTPELRGKIDDLATGYALASVEAEKLAEKQERVRDAAQELNDLGRDVFGGFISDLREGTSAAEALSNALGKVGDRLLEWALDDLFGGGGKNGGGIFGKLLSSILHQGGVVGQGGTTRSVNPAAFAGAKRMHTGAAIGLRPDEVPAIVQKGEIVLPKGFGRGNGRGGNASPTVYHIDARGAQLGVGEEIKRALTEYDRGRKARLAADIPDLMRRGAL